MSTYLLDTNILSDLVRKPSGAAARRVAEVGAKAVCTSIVVAAELRYGCAKKGSAALTAKVNSLLATLPVLALDAPTDTHYGDIRAQLERAGQSIGANDLLIAAQARALGLILVSANVQEFKRVPDLALENWLEA